MVMIRRAHPQTLVSVLTALMLAVLTPSVEAQVTGAPDTFKVTVTKVEMLTAGGSWVEIFSGSAELDLVGAGTFPGIANIDLPAGTYTGLRVTINNSLKVTGSLVSGATRYVTSTDACAATGNAAGCALISSAGVVAPGSEFAFSNPAWGALGASTLLDEITFSTPLTVTEETDYQPTLTFSVAGTLSLTDQGGGGAGPFTFGLSAPTVSVN